MLSKATNRGWGHLALGVVALYTLLVSAAAYEHHDFACELKNPQHCTACTSSGISADPNSPTIPGVLLLADAGAAILFDIRAQTIVLSDQTTGRSPPVSTHVVS